MFPPCSIGSRDGLLWYETQYQTVFKRVNGNAQIDTQKVAFYNLCKTVYRTEIQ